MKKMILAAAVLFSAITASNANPDDITLLSGSNSWLSDNAKAQIVYHLENTVVTNKNANGQTCDQYFANKENGSVEDWHKAVEFGKKMFCHYFNEKKSKKIGITAQQEEDGCKYRIEVMADKINLGSTAGMIIGLSRRDFGMQMWGKINIVEVATGNVVASYDMKKVKGEGYPGLDTRMRFVSTFMAKAFIDQKVK